MTDLQRVAPKHPKQKLVVKVGVTPSINHMYIFGKGHKTLTKEAKTYIQDTQNVCAEAMRQCKWKKEESGVWYYMDLYFYFPDKRIRDSHNCIKLLLDSLQGLLFHNDYFVMPRIQHVCLNREEPHIRIEFYPQDI